MQNIHLLIIKKNGSFSYHYKSSKLKEIGTYNDDVVHGKVSFFEEDGTLSMEVEFKNGNPVSATWGDGRKWNNAELSNWENGLKVNCGY